MTTLSRLLAKVRGKGHPNRATVRFALSRAADRTQGEELVAFVRGRTGLELALPPGFMFPVEIEASLRLPGDDDEEATAALVDKLVKAGATVSDPVEGGEATDAGEDEPDADAGGGGEGGDRG